MRCRWRKVLHMTPLIKGIVSQESWTLLYQSDFSGGADGFSAVSNVTLTPNYDSGDPGYAATLRTVSTGTFCSASKPTPFIAPPFPQTLRVTMVVKPIVGSDHSMQLRNLVGSPPPPLVVGVWNEIVWTEETYDPNDWIDVSANSGFGSPGDEMLIGSVKIERRL